MTLDTKPARERPETADVAATVDAEKTTDVASLLDHWNERTEHDLAFSPGPVQDLLFELWGAAENDPGIREEIERWLTLSLTRNLFGAEELRELFGRCREALVPVSSV